MRSQVINKVSIILVWMGVCNIMLSQVAHITAKHDGHCEQNEKDKFHPCQENGTVSSSNGVILCLVPTEEELMEKLKNIGGLNRYYAAVTLKEAANFVNLLPRVRPTFSQLREKPFPIIWSYLSSAVSRKLKTVSHNMKLKSRKPNLYQKAESRNLIGMSGIGLDNNIIRSKKLRCVQSGEQTEQGLFRLCSECQRISQLNSDRFPHYINEVACENETTSKKKQRAGCHRLPGICTQRFLYLDFLVKTEKFLEVPSPNPDKFPKAFKQVWEPYTQKVRSCCECQLV